MEQASVIRRFASSPRTRAPAALLLMLTGLPLLDACASHKAAPAAASTAAADPAAPTSGLRPEPPPETRDSAATPADIEHPAESRDDGDKAAPKNTDRSVIATDSAAASQATPAAAVQAEPGQGAGPEKPQVPADSPEDPCDRPERSDEILFVDDTREMLEEQSCSAALWLDGLFGKAGDTAAARRTRGFLEMSNVYSQFEGFDSRARLHVEFDLPVAKNQLSAFVGRENDEDFVRGRTDASELRSTFPTLSEQNEWLAGLGYSLPDTRNLQTSFRVGVRGLGPPTGFVQGRLRYTLYSDDNDVAYVKTTPFWNTRDGFGVTQSFDYSHVLSRHYLARWYSVGTVSERTVGLNWRHSAILYHNLEHKRGLAYEAFVRGETDEPEPLYEYGSRVLFRHPFLSDRLFAEWAAGYSFPRTDPDRPRDGSASIGVSVELPFGDPRE